VGGAVTAHHRDGFVDLGALSVAEAGDVALDPGDQVPDPGDLLLGDAERAQIDEAVAVVRRHRAAHAVPLGMPAVRAGARVPLTATTATPEAIA
jgi:hypothetical protein